MPENTLPPWFASREEEEASQRRWREELERARSASTTALGAAGGAVMEEPIRQREVPRPPNSYQELIDTRPTAKKKKGNIKLQNLTGKVVELQTSYSYKDVSLEKGVRAVALSTYGKGVRVEVQNSKKEMVNIPIPYSFFKVIEIKEEIQRPQYVDSWATSYYVTGATTVAGSTYNPEPFTSQNSRPGVYSIMVAGIGVRDMRLYSDGTITDLGSGYAHPLDRNWMLHSAINRIPSIVEEYFSRVLNTNSNELSRTSTPEG